MQDVQATTLADELAPDWAAIAVVILGVTAFAAGQGLTYPLIALLLESRGVSSSLAGLNAATFAAGLVAAVFSVGPMTNWIRSDRLIVYGLVGASLSLAAFAMSDALWVWFVARFTLGFSTSIIYTMSEAWLNSASPDRLRGRMSGAYGAGMCAGFSAGPLVIPIFGTADGFAFALTAIYIAFVAFVSVMLGRLARTRPEAASPDGVMRFVRVAPILVLMVVAFGFSDIAAIASLPIYFARLGHSDAFAALAVTMVALPTAVAQPLVGWLLDRLPRMLITVFAALIAAVSLIALPLVTSETGILLLISVLGAASFSIYTCALTLLGDRFRGGLLVSGSAAFGLAYAIGSAAGSGATGVVMDLVSPHAGPVMTGLLMLVFAAIFTLSARRNSVVEPGA